MELAKVMAIKTANANRNKLNMMMKGKDLKEFDFVSSRCRCALHKSSLMKVNWRTTRSERKKVCRSRIEEKEEKWDGEIIQHPKCSYISQAIEPWRA